MAAYSTHLLLLVILLVQLPLVLSGSRLPSWMLLLGVLGLGQPILFVLAQQVLYRDWFKRLRHLPTLLLIAIGIAPSNSWAVIRALSADELTFHRTPKGLRRSYLSPPDQSRFLEIGILIYLLITLYFAIQRANSGPLVLVISSLLGIGYVAMRSLIENLTSKRQG
jgi:hypothetical protein